VNVLYRRLIPKILVEHTSGLDPSAFRSILTRSYKPFRVVGEPLSQIRIQQSNLVDEIMLIHRNESKFDSSFCDLVLKSCELLNTPLSVGGAIESPAQAKMIFESGADKLVVGRHRGNIALLEDVASNHGVQSLAVSIDYSSKDISSGAEALWERELSLGYLSLAGEICVNNISRDGQGVGVDLSLIGLIREQTTVPVIVGGGISNVSHIAECFRMGCDGVTLSTFLSQSDQNIRQLRSHLSSLGIHIRTRN